MLSGQYPGRGTPAWSSADQGISSWREVNGCEGIPWGQGGGGEATWVCLGAALPAPPSTLQGQGSDSPHIRGKQRQALGGGQESCPLQRGDSLTEGETRDVCREGQPFISQSKCSCGLSTWERTQPRDSTWKRSKFCRGGFNGVVDSPRNEGIRRGTDP